MTQQALDCETVRRAAVGREVELMVALGGLTAAVLHQRKGGPCPWCGGTDRFALMKRGDAVICRKCAPRGLSVFDVVMRVHSCTFAKAVNMVGEYLGSTRPPARRQRPATRPRTYRTASDAVQALEKILGRREWMWVYHNAAEKPIGVIVRWKNAKGKTIRPVALHADGWRIGGMPQPFPLYNLPALAKSETVIVTEGEKAADAARRHGYVATTSPHGAKSAEKADWSPLAGKRVMILPDNDPPGEEYAAAVASILHRLRPAVTVSIVRLPNLPDGGDVADWNGNLAEFVQ